MFKALLVSNIQFSALLWSQIMCLMSWLSESIIEFGSFRAIKILMSL